MNDEQIIRRPCCRYCRQPMIASFCIAYKEYVCIPCGFAAEFLNGLDRIETTYAAEKSLREKYKDDMRRLAFTQGFASCKDCGNSGGNNCETCAFPSEFKFWNKKAVIP